MTSIPQTELDAFVNRTRATASESLNISALSRFASRVAGTPSANAGAVALAEIQRRHYCRRALVGMVPQELLTPTTKPTQRHRRHTR